MAGSKRTETAEAAVISRRDAIVGALALAAGTLIATRPEAALAAGPSYLELAAYNLCEAETRISRAPAGFPANCVSNVYLNFGVPANPDKALLGSVTGLAAPESTGVWGEGSNPDHFGVVALNEAVAGTALWASAPAGTGLMVDGKVSLSRSGRHSFTKGHSTHTVTVASGVGVDAMILVTLQGSPGSGVYLKYAKRISETTFRVYLNKAATSTATFAWMILD